MAASPLTRRLFVEASRLLWQAFCFRQHPVSRLVTSFLGVGHYCDRRREARRWILDIFVKIAITFCCRAANWGFEPELAKCRGAWGWVLLFVRLSGPLTLWPSAKADAPLGLVVMLLFSAGPVLGSHVAEQRAALTPTPLPRAGEGLLLRQPLAEAAT